MAKGVKVSVNYSGVGQLLKSEEMKSILEQHASATVAKLGSGYSYNSYVGKTRVNTSITVDTWDAWRENQDENKVLKALT